MASSPGHGGGGCGPGRSAREWISRAVENLSPKLGRRFRGSAAGPGSDPAGGCPPSPRKGGQKRRLAAQTCRADASECPTVLKQRRPGPSEAAAISVEEKSERQRGVGSVGMRPASELPVGESVSTGAATPPRSPTSVQEWVDSLPASEEDHPPREWSGTRETQDDGLVLGAEARSLANSLAPPRWVGAENTAVGGPKTTLGDLRSKQSSFNSEASGFSTISSISSVDSLLEARREDPEELLLALGFCARTPLEDDPLGRIPERFLAQPSAARGISPPLTSRSPSLSSGPAARFLQTVELARKNFVSHFPTANTSILEPANRAFLREQGADDGAQKKIVLGEQTFSVDLESGAMHLAPDQKRIRWRSAVHRAHGSLQPGDSEEPPVADEEKHRGRPLLRRQTTVIEQQQAERSQDSHGVVQTELPELGEGWCQEAGVDRRE